MVGWAEWDAEQGSGVAAMERDLREYLFGEQAARTRGHGAAIHRHGEKLFVNRG